MGRPRSELQAILTTLLGSSNVYFQQPPTIGMQYPAIVYTLDNVRTNFANNFPYKRKKRYQVMVIDSNPDSLIPDKVGALQMCTFDRRYSAEQLNHDVFTIYF